MNFGEENLSIILQTNKKYLYIFDSKVTKIILLEDIYKLKDICQLTLFLPPELFINKICDVESIMQHAVVNVFYSSYYVC